MRQTEQVLNDKHGTNTPLQTLQALVIALIYAISVGVGLIENIPRLTKSVLIYHRHQHPP